MEFENAKSTLWEAVNLDQRGFVNQALVKYTLGIEGLLQCLTEFEEPKRNALTRQIEQYMSRAETLKSKQMIKVEFLEQRKIAEDSIGHSYESIFAKCLGNVVVEVSVEEPWLNYLYQVINFVKFCELLVRTCPNINKIGLVTQPTSLVDALEELRTSMKARRVELLLRYRENMHDREIRFDNGWLVKMGRGLDIYKNVGKFALGSYDYNLRPCKASVIEVFKTSKS